MYYLSSEDVVGDVEGYKIKINEALQYSNSRNSGIFFYKPC